MKCPNCHAQMDMGKQCDYCDHDDGDPDCDCDYCADDDDGPVDDDFDDDGLDDDLAAWLPIEDDSDLDNEEDA